MLTVFWVNGKFSFLYSTLPCVQHYRGSHSSWSAVSFQAASAVHSMKTRVYQQSLSQQPGLAPAFSILFPRYQWRPMAKSWWVGMLLLVRHADLSVCLCFAIKIFKNSCWILLTSLCLNLFASSCLLRIKVAMFFFSLLGSTYHFLKIIEFSFICILSSLMNFKVMISELTCFFSIFKVGIMAFCSFLECKCKSNIF